MDDQELQPLFPTGDATAHARASLRNQKQPHRHTKSAGLPSNNTWFAKDSVSTRQPASTPQNNGRTQYSLSDDDDPFVDEVATTTDTAREIPISRPSNPTPSATPVQSDPEPTHQANGVITIPIMLYKCKPMFRNGTQRIFGKVLHKEPDEISLDASTSYDELFLAVSAKLIRRFGDEAKISSLEDHACLYKIVVEHDRDSTQPVKKRDWMAMLESIRIELLFGRKIVLNLWFASFVEFEKEERQWWKKVGDYFCCGLRRK